MVGDVVSLAGNGNAGQFAREALSEKLRRPASWEPHRYAEVQLQPRRGSSVDQVLELMAARSPLVGDFVSADGDMDPRLRRALRKALSPTQARRVELAFRGFKLETIGHMEGCSKQAVWASLKRADRDLINDDQFVVACCRIYKESGLDPTILLEAIYGQD